jgi:hypothetical protein
MHEVRVEACDQRRLVEDHELARAAFEVDRPVSELLDRSAELQHMLAATPARVDKLLEDEPAAHGRPTEQRCDQQESGEHALPER